MPHMPGWCPYCGKTIDELYANVLRRKGELWHRKCWKASCKEIADARRANEDRLDNIIGHPKREWSVKKPEPETWNEKISRRVVASCPRCGKVIPDLTDDIVIRGKKLYHRDCWKTEAKGKEIARRSIDDIISGRFEQRRWNLDKLARKSNREWTIKYGSRIIKRKGQKPKRTRPYIKEIHYHKPGQPDITLDVGYLRPWHNKDGDIKEHFVVNSVMFLPGGGEFPWHLRLVTTEHRLAKECREQVQRKNRFARILSKTFYGRKWYVVYENYHKGKITGMTSAPRSERSRTQEREIKEEIKRHNELALKRMRDNNPNPGTYKHLLETLPSSISGRIVKHRKLENRTWELILDDGTRIIRLFNTNIIVWKPNGDLVLDTGGWNTITTYDRINRYSPVHIWSVKNSLYVGISGEHWIGDLKPRERQKLWTKYYDGITFRKTAAGKWREVGDDGKIIGWNKTKK